MTDRINSSTSEAKSKAAASYVIFVIGIQYKHIKMNSDKMYLGFLSLLSIIWKEVFILKENLLPLFLCYSILVLSDPNERKM